MNYGLAWKGAAAPSWIAWRDARFTAAEIADAAIGGESADADGDGLSNRLEYALSGDPTTADAATRAPVRGVDQGFPTLSYRRVVGAKDLVYAVEGSDDLVAWSAAGFVETGAVNQGATEWVTVRDGSAMGGAAAFTRAGGADTVTTPEAGGGFARVFRARGRCAHRRGG